MNNRPARDNLASATSSLAADRWLRLLVVAVATCVVGIPLSDLLPGAIEDLVRTALFVVFAIVTAGWSIWFVSFAGRTAIYRRCRVTLRIILIAITICSVIVATGSAYGVSASNCVVLILTQLATPAFVISQWRQDLPLRAAILRGAAIGFVSFFVYGSLYGLLIGIDGGYLVGKIGPGFQGWGNCEALLFFLVIAVWPVAAILACGAVSGFVGWAIRRSPTTLVHG
jgi:hypothetical protein